MLKKRKRSHLRRKRIPTSILLRSKRKVCPLKKPELTGLIIRTLSYSKVM